MQITRIAHPNIVKCLKYIDAPYIQPFGQNSIAVLDYDDQASFLKIKNQLQEPLARFYFLHMMSALQYLHDLGVCHRNICLGNLLMSNYTLKISNF